MKRTLVRCVSILALSLGIFISSPTITPTRFDTVRAEEYVSDVKPRWEYSTHGWYFTREETKQIYEKEYEEGTRLENCIRIENGKYVAYRYGEKFEVPEKFVKGTLRQLEETLEKGYAEYIFRLDAFHSHLFVPDDVFEKYKDLKNGAEVAEAYTKDEQLGALYHNTEHLAIEDPKTGEIDPVAEELRSKRSVLGWYDGRPLEITHPKETDIPQIIEANSASIPDGYHNIGSLTFKATKNGEFAIKHNGKEIRIDISFDGDYYY
ncbi:MAG: hypothetical protein Q8O03_04075 [Nanoarchaeota archaeon]|nr:hypothetical protein [Nanoarchaeota archaeon]